MTYIANAVWNGCLAIVGAAIAVVILFGLAYGYLIWNTHLNP